MSFANTSILINRQVPEFVREEYPLFITFLEAYYEFLEQKQTGELCKMITGPGEIIGITQTIFQDNYGLPVLKRADLPHGGK